MRAGLRGFTLVEMLAVLCLISILVVAAAPTFVRTMRDRRINRAAMNAVDIYRTARTMAVGRGLPMLVVWDAGGVFTNNNPGSTGIVQLFEPTIISVSNRKTCSQIDWSANNLEPPTACNDGQVRPVMTLDIKDGRFDYTQFQFRDTIVPTPNVVAHSEVCFSPTGRTYVRYTSGTGVFSPLVGVLSIAVTNVDSDPNSLQPRIVFIPPSGMARLQL